MSRAPARAHPAGTGPAGRRPPADPAARPPRGDAEATRVRLVTAAAAAFEEDGYQGTDSNAIARRAGYSPGTFYKHFPDKRAIFMAVYASWVSAEWAAIEPIVRAPGSVASRARRLVALTVGLHAQWRGFRTSLRALVAWDAEVRAFHRAQRNRQLATIARLRRVSGARGSREADAMLLFTMERACDALADGELAALRLRSGRITRHLERLVAAHLAVRRPPAAAAAPRRRGG
jgi:AcrR family transcriptional regulator